jgi:O-antigen/teichoic acid export membrane protein
MMRKFGGAGALVALGRLTFMVFVVIAGRTVSPTDFGRFMVALASSQILALICTLGTGPSAQVIVSDALARARPALAFGFVRFALAITVGVSLATGAVLLVASLLLRRAGWINADSDVMVPITLLLFPMSLSALRELVARAMGSSMLAFTPRDVVWTGLMGALLLLSHAVASDMMIWAAGSLLVVEVLAWGMVWRFHLAPLRSRRRDVSAYYRRWLKHSVTMLFNYIVGFLFERIDTFAVSAFTSLAVAGVYAAASRVATIVSISQRFVVPVVLPNIVAALGRRDLPRARSEIRHGIVMSLLFALPVFLGILLFAEPIMAIFGEGFRPYGNVLRILAAAQFSLAMNGPIGAALTASSPYIYARFGWIALTVTVLLLVTLTPLFGAMGAALAVMLGIGIQVVLVFVAVNQRYAIVRQLRGAKPDRVP